MSGRIIVADADALRRLSMFNLEDVLRRSDQHLVIVDLVEFDVYAATPDGPEAERVRAWITALYDRSILERATTTHGIALSVLRDRQVGDNIDDQLARLLRDGAFLALRDYIEELEPDDTTYTILVYERPIPSEITAACKIKIDRMPVGEFLPAESPQKARQ